MVANFPNRIEGRIEANHVEIGIGVIVEAGVVIGGNHGGPAERVVLGDFCYIGRDTRIIAPEFRLGEFSKLHAGSFGKGDQPLQIGRCCWIGGNTILDSMGGLDIDDFVGIGAQSQIWTHAQFGDIVEGSRFHSQKYMHLSRDVWFVGHCIVSPVLVGERSMALAGSVITREMLPNHIYGGVPASDLTERLGTQFEDRTTEQKGQVLQRLITEFEEENPDFSDMLQIAFDPSEIQDDGRTWFDVSNRVYTRRRSSAEVAFLTSNVPLVKFTPMGSAPFIELRSRQ